MDDRSAGAARRGVLRKGRIYCALALLAIFAFGAKAWHDTMAVPVVRRTTVALQGLPVEAPPLRLVLLSDIHVAGPDMPPSRLAEIVVQVNELHPDLVLIAGDFVSDKDTATRHYSTTAAIAPLGKLKPRLATVVVPGNHDHWRDIEAIRTELHRRGIVVLANQARRFGSLTIGGLDDDFTGRADLPATLRALRSLGGAAIVLSHSPDPFPDLPRDFGVMLAGHTHCGQLRYPWGGTPATMSRYGDRYACGMVRENGNVLITTGGLGTSVLPFRFGTGPEIWLIELRPRRLIFLHGSRLLAFVRFFELLDSRTFIEVIGACVFAPIFRNLSPRQNRAKRSCVQMFIDAGRG